MKENKKIPKYLDFVGRRKKLWNLKGMVSLIVVGTLETVSKGMEK